MPIAKFQVTAGNRFIPRELCITAEATWIKHQGSDEHPRGDEDGFPQ
jgi:hypothetical protein